MKRIYFLSWSLLACSIFCFHPLLSFQQGATAKKILEQIAARYEAMKAFSFSIHYSLKHTQTSTKKSFDGKGFLQGDRYILDMGAQIIHCDGLNTWTYLPEAEEVTLTTTNKDEGMNLRQMLSLYKGNYSFFMRKAEKNTYLIELIPKDNTTTLFKIALQINKQKKNY